MTNKNSGRTHTCGDLRKEQVGETVTLAGWVRRRRDHGGLVFIDLWDRFGITQVALNPQVDASAHELAHSLRAEFVLQITGKVSERPEGTINKKLPTGAIEIYADTAVILNSSETPPFVMDEQEAPGETMKLKYRYLEIRRGPLLKNLEMRSLVSATARNFLVENGFLEIETPALTRSTPEGARDYLVPSRVNQGHFYALPQSPQLFKQMLMVAGADRYYQIVKCFRDEDLRADRQPEFTQIDMEMSFADEEEIIKLCENMMAAIFKTAKGIDIKLPFPRIEYDDAMNRYGKDAPDTRFGMEMADVSELVKESDFKVFNTVVAEGNTVRSLAVPGGAKMSRKEIDTLIAEAQSYGAGGMAWIKVTDDGYQSSIVKFFTPEILDGIKEATGANSGDLLVFIADTKEVAFATLGSLRLSIAKQLGIIDNSQYAFTWVTEFPLVEYDEEEKRHTALHHPFTAPLPEDMELIDTEPTKVRSRAYDLVLNGSEIGGGSIRIHDQATQQKMFDLLGIGADEAREKFGFLLDALQYGAPPHGGIAFGLDRIVAILAGAESIRDVIAFPKTQKAQCMLTEAPAAVDRRQLRDLGLKKDLT